MMRVANKKGRVLPKAIGSVVGAVAMLGVAACGDDDVTSAPDDDPQAARGQQVFEANGCASCHSTSGDRRTGPPLDGIYGEEVELADGTTVVRDDDYLTRAVTDPGADVVDGYQPAMPTFSFDDEDLDALVAYIRFLSD